MLGRGTSLEFAVMAREDEGGEEEDEEERIGGSFSACDGERSGGTDMVEEDGAGDTVVGEGG